MFQVEGLLLNWLLTLLSASVVGITGVIPALLIPHDATLYLATEDGRNYMNYFLSFAVGSILGDVFMHLLPETWELYLSHPEVGNHSKIGIMIITGIVVFLMIEKMCSDESEVITEVSNSNKNEKTALTNDGLNNDEYNSSDNLRRRKFKDSSSNDHNEVEQKRKNPVKIEGYLNLLANIVDNFAHGLAVGVSYSVSPSVGFITTICILIHEIPHEVSDFAILLRSGFDRNGAIRAQLATASSSLFGAITALVSDSATAGLSKAYILPFSCGGFLYVALVSLVPDLTKEENSKESLKQFILILLGIAVTSCLAVTHI